MAFNTVDTDDFDGWRADRVAFYADSRQYVQERDYVPRTIVVEDLVNRTRTELTVEAIELDQQLPRRLFSQRQLESQGH